jgi:pimeloyl-ACP methyl ester carboxylesterase
VTQPAGRRLLVDYDGSRIHGLFAAGGQRWDIGSGLGTRKPATGTAVFSRDRLDLGSQRATRIPQIEREVRFRSGRTWLAGTLAVPTGASGRPGVVLVHGSGATTRNDPAVLAAYFEAQGFAVLTYDKRGIGQSGGEYPGEAATDASIDVYARDAAAAARFLVAQPEVDRARVGLAGSSQAGWIAPVAAAREPAIRFLALVSGPTVTAGEISAYAALTTQGNSIPADSPAAIVDRVRQGGPSGFDPAPALRRLAIPSLWLYGALDQHVPTVLCVERLAGTGADVRVFPRADHFLIESEHGLAAEDLRSDRYADGAFLALGSWLAAHGLR